MDMKRMCGLTILLLLILLLLILQLITFPTTANAFDNISNGAVTSSAEISGISCIPSPRRFLAWVRRGGAGATVLNMGGTDADFIGFKLVGAFKASGYDSGFARDPETSDLRC
jgi:hypothetical protein